METNAILKKPITLFIIKAIAFYFAWDLIMIYYLDTHPFSFWLSHLVNNTALYCLDMMGYTVRGYNTVIGININGKACVFMGNPCNGLDFMGIFLCLVIAYPAHWKSKTWFLPIGIIAIHFLNVLRVILLALNVHYWKSTFDFNHKYTFMIAVYVLIFLLWTYWAKRYKTLASNA
ncbi:MAG: hypothetical protein EAZ31_04865 [Cytophagia bacterium]|nr:MAG: hypothetical protein EAZ31_04865 [Cytophagia bacterium]TAH28775.1 MAG: hypothetical protein EAZ06_08960 [Cytophagales bacterium]